jgi:peptide/nickel transport system permease protein
MSRWRRFFLHWENWLGLLLLLVFTVGAVTAPILSPADPDQHQAFKQLGRASDFRPHPPGEDAILGTMPGQYDVFHTLIWGMRDAMIFGIVVALGSFLIGVFFGAVSGYAGGFVNGLMMRVADAFLTFPPIAGVVFLQQLVLNSIVALGGVYYFDTLFFGRVVSLYEPPTRLVALLGKIDPVMIALIIVSWVPYARLVNSVVLTLKGTEYIQAARALGASPLWVVRRHLLPNSVGPAVVLAARDVGSAVILQATITFIGLGGLSPWGNLLSMGRNFVLGPGGSLLTHWWVFLPVTLAVILFGLAWNLIGDGLNEILVPEAQTGLPGRRAWKRQPKEEPVMLMPPEELLSPAPAIVHPVVHALGTDLSETSSDESRTEADRLKPFLGIATAALARGDLSRALHAYQQLIRHGEWIEEILPELVRLAEQYPRDARVWQTLGDALTQAGDTERALQSYEQARKLMQ